MNLSKKIVLSSIALALASQLSTLMASGPIDQQQIDRAMPMVVKAVDGLFVDVPLSANLVTMNVRVYNSQNELVFTERSNGELIGLLSGDLADGKYRYEAVTVFQLDAPVGHGPSYSDEGISRDFGDFTVGGGLILDGSQSMQQSTLDDASLLDQVLEKSMHLAGLTLDFIIPSAQAANVNVSSGVPSVFFNDTDITAQTNEWVLRAVEGSPEFQLRDLVNGNTVLEFDTSNNNRRSMFVDASGDVHFANGTLNLDKSLQNMAIGWSDTANGNFSISDTKPHVWFHDETDTAEADWQLNDATVKFWSRPSSLGIWRIPLNFNVNAPENSLSFNSSGDAGFGTSSPAAALEVRRTNGSAQILVDENSGTASTRTLFKIENKGLTKFIINNTTGAEWAFANKGTSFRISRQGSGQVEMEVFNNGNMTIQGSLTQNSDVNQKTNIEEIDQGSILQRITEMSISQWQYKDTLGENHIGPMAQDFYAAFGLGQSETGLSSIDTAGVALAAIQALASENSDLRQQIQSQADRLQELENQQIMMQTMVSSILEAQQASPLLTKTAMN